MALESFDWGTGKPRIVLRVGLYGWRVDTTLGPNDTLAQFTRQQAQIAACGPDFDTALPWEK